MALFLKDFEHLKFRLEDIISATNNFADDKVIGTGGFGRVYRGEVSHSMGKSMGAFKRLDRRHGMGDPEFWKEILMLSGYKHKNLITLLGFCDEVGEKIVVYEYASNGSLDHHLSSTHLTWRQCIKICLDAARGLSFLHDDRGTMQRVIHRDVKSSNILLDDNWNGKVAGMELSKTGPANQQHSFLITNVVGTHGYCDPQYMETSMLTKESDVYSFGVVLMEVLCGRLCFNYINGQLNILVRTWKIAYTQKKLHEIVFQGRMPPMNSSSLKIFSDVAFQCLRRSPEERPTMAHVIEKLENALAFQKSSITYEDGLKDMVSSLKYRSVKVHKMLFTRGIYLNGGKKWFSLNDKGEHCEMISISDCLIPYESEDYTPRYSANQMSRFTSGSYLTGGKQFKTHVRTQYLSPLVTYTVSLVFRCPIKLKEKVAKQQYISLNYELEGETKILIVHLVDFPEDGWLMGELYRFTSDQRIVDVEILFKNHACCSDLEIDGIEFHPLENVELEVLEYQQILKAMARPLIYRSQEELKVLLSKGVLLNRGKTWFSLNDSGEHCEMISIAECLVPRQDFYDICQSIIQDLQ